MLRRDHDGPRRDGGAAVYHLRQRLMAVGDDYWVQDAAGQRVYRIDGKVARLRKTLLMELPDGRELYKLKEHVINVRDTMAIEGRDGTVALVKHALINPIRERFSVHLEKDGDEWDVHGNVVDHEYQVTGPAGRIGEVSKKWLRVADTYSVEVEPGQDDALVIAVAIVIDEMAHPHK
jgi:uncharacterized protein YxjI